MMWPHAIIYFRSLDLVCRDFEIINTQFISQEKEGTLVLRETTREIIRLVEETSGIPVQVTEDPNLQTIASVRMARRGGLPQHLIVYKPESGETPDYQICFQCGFIIRMFDSLPGNRFDIVSTKEGQDDIDNLIRAPGELADKFRLRKSQITEFRNQFLSGLVIHLRSVPVGLRISSWLSSSYPEFGDLQKIHVQKEIQINKQSLSAEIRAITPSEVYKATQSISAAYAIYWAEQYSRPEWVHPYHQQRFDIPGHDLLEISNTIPTDPGFDKELIIAWGEYLNIHEWFDFVPYDPGI